jgi:hypothetical protein
MGNEALNNRLISINSNTLTKSSPQNNRNIVLAPILDEVDISLINRQRYFLETCNLYKDLTGLSFENNPYIDKKIKELQVHFDNKLDEKYLTSSIGLYKMINKLSIRSPQTTTLDLITGKTSNYLIIDVDNPESDANK